MAIHSGALSSTQVNDLYQGTKNPLTVVNNAVTPGPPDPAAKTPGSWSLVIVPDTQNYMTLNNGIAPQISQWIVDNKTTQNIGLVVHVGDITNNNSTTEWSRAKTMIQTLDGEVPYILNTGNHDLDR